MKVSRLDIKKYPWGNPKRWLIFKYANQSGIDPVFAGRLAAMAASLGVVFTIVRGSVTTEEQQMIANLKLQQNPSWTRRPNGAIYNQRGQCMVAAPGMSLHEDDLAIDGDNRIEAISNYTLAKFGLCRPMGYEPWHIQPIETKGMTIEARRKIAPYEIEGTVSEVQTKIGIPADNVYGPNTHVEVRKHFPEPV